MGTTTSLSARRGSRGKYILFGVLGLATLFVLYNNERFVIDHTDPDWSYFYPVRWWLLVHGLGGALALFLGPLQFSTRIRQKYLRFHRVLGLCYVVGVAIAAPMSLYLEYQQDPPSYHPAAFVQAGSWLLTTALAFYFVKQRKIQQHRQWMIRSYAVTLIFVEVRTIFALPIFHRYGEAGLLQVIWFCNVCAWIVPTLILQWRELAPARAASSS
jgi:uncharacterized membrane protein